MSWVSRLCETYDNCSADVVRADIQDEVIPLLPIGHTTQYAQIKIVLDNAGNYVRSRALEKTEANTIIPCTEDSVNRPGKKIALHPLFDKLQYIAGDYPEYITSKESGFDLYSKQLKLWCDSPYGNDMIRAVYTYTQKKMTIHNLLESGVLLPDDSANIMDSWKGEGDKTVIFTQAASPSDAFVRFCVETPGDVQETRLWLNPKVRHDFIVYYQPTFTEKGRCYITGKLSSISRLSSAKIRHSGDGAKLISSNDTSGFTYRGRFRSASEDAAQSYEVSQKSVSALKWLVEKQEYKNGDQAIVAWATNNAPVPPKLYDLFDADIYSGEISKQIPTLSLQHG